MYENFYGFREKPFSLLPDSGFLYLSSKHRIALTLLEYGLLNQAGFTVISGDIGTGKTTLIRQLLNQIDPGIKVGLISNTHQTFGDLLQWIALAFELPHQGKDKVTLYRDFMDFIIREYGQGRRTVLIVDEAQNMSAETLEELRMLSNINTEKDQLPLVDLDGGVFRVDVFADDAHLLIVLHDLQPATPHFLRVQAGAFGIPAGIGRRARGYDLHKAKAGVFHRFAQRPFQPPGVEHRPARHKGGAAGCRQAPGLSMIPGILRRTKKRGAEAPLCVEPVSLRVRAAARSRDSRSPSR